MGNKILSSVYRWYRGRRNDLFSVQSWTTTSSLSLFPLHRDGSWGKDCHCHCHHMPWISLSSWIWPKCSSGNHDHCSQWLLSLWSVVCWCWECESSSPLTRTPGMFACKLSGSVMSDSLWPHGLWDFPGKSTGVGCHFLLQGINTGLSCVSCIGRWVLYHCTTWEAPPTVWQVHKPLQTLKVRHKPGLPSLLSPGEQWREGVRNIQF